MEKVLWFEGAGCEGTQRNDVPNCRIRTVFVNNDERWVYLEIFEGHVSKESAKSYAGKAGWKAGDSYCIVDSAFYLTDDPEIDDANHSRISIDVHSGWHRWYWGGCKDGNVWDTVKPYTMDGILRIVNEDCHASFDRIEVSTDVLAGYYVFRDNNKHHTHEHYNRGDLFKYDKHTHDLMLAKRAELMEYHKRVFDERFDNTSYWNASDGSYTSQLMNVHVSVCKSKFERVYKQRDFVIDVTEEG